MPNANILPNPYLVPYSLNHGGSLTGIQWVVPAYYGTSQAAKQEVILPEKTFESRLFSIATATLWCIPFKYWNRAPEMKCRDKYFETYISFPFHRKYQYVYIYILYMHQVWIHNLASQSYKSPYTSCIHVINKVAISIQSHLVKMHSVDQISGIDKRQNVN